MVRGDPSCYVQDRRQPYVSGAAQNGSIGMWYTASTTQSISTAPGTRAANASIKPSPMKAVCIPATREPPQLLATRKVGRKRPLPLWKQQEVQAMPRQQRLTGNPINTTTATLIMPPPANEDIAQVFESMASLLEFKGDAVFKIRGVPEGGPHQSTHLPLPAGTSAETMAWT